MNSKPAVSDVLREKIIAQPDVILEDQALMRALVTANERAMPSNIVDLRGIAMERLEARLARLETTHRSVIAAAYENLSSTNQVQRAVLRMLDPTSFEDFLLNLGGDVASILRVDRVRLVLETTQTEEDPVLARVGDVLALAEPGFVHSYLSHSSGPARRVTLRQINEGSTEMYGEGAEFLRSEACIVLDFGPGSLPGMLTLGAEDPHQFSPQKGTDLLSFLGGVFERAMRRWLS